MMRIIAGRARGVRLSTLEGEVTRPTSERAKEAVFSMIQFELADKRVLDLFAGSGQMGLEAVSRGAASAVLVDDSSQAVDVIRANVKKTRLEEECRVVCADYQAFLHQRCPDLAEQYDVVFLDPPYAGRLVVPALQALINEGRLAKEALIVCESEESDVFERDQTLASRFIVRRRAKYGVAHMTLLEYKPMQQQEV